MSDGCKPSDTSPYEHNASPPPCASHNATQQPSWLRKPRVRAGFIGFDRTMLRDLYPSRQQRQANFAFPACRDGFEESRPPRTRVSCHPFVSGRFVSYHKTSSAHSESGVARGVPNIFCTFFVLAHVHNEYSEVCEKDGLSPRQHHRGRVCVLSHEAHKWLLQKGQI